MSPSIIDRYPALRHLTQVGCPACCRWICWAQTEALACLAQRIHLRFCRASVPLEVGCRYCAEKTG